MTAKKNQSKNQAQDSDSQAFTNEKDQNCLSDNSPIDVKSNNEESVNINEQSKRVTLPKHTSDMYKKLAALKSGGQKPEFTIPSTQLTVAQQLLERLKHNMMNTCKTPTRMNTIKKPLTERSGEVVKIETLV